MIMGMRKGCLITLLATAGIFALAFYYFFIASFGPQKGDMRLVSYGRGIWIAIISANSEREAKGVTTLWPKELGFSRSRSSTEYFRRLMSDETGRPTTNPADRIAGDLAPYMLGSHGVRQADSVADFRRENNAWIVICIGSNTPSDTAFLVSRNVDLGKTAGSTSKLLLVKSPITSPRRHVVWITRGGGAFEASPESVTGAQLFPSTNETYDVMYP